MLHHQKWTNNNEIDTNSTFKPLFPVIFWTLIFNSAPRNDFLVFPSGHTVKISAFEIQVLSTLAIKYRSDFRIFQLGSAIHRQKNCRKLPMTDTIVYYVGNGFDIPRYFAKSYGLIFKKWDCLFYLIILFTYNGWKRRQYFSRWWPCFGFFVCLYYSRRTHYPTLEKPGTKNQGKLREFNDHWKLIKTFF